MKKFFFLVLWGLKLALPAGCQEEIFLTPEHLPLQLCMITDLHQAITDLVRIRIDQFWHAGQYKKIFPLFFLISRIDPEDKEAWATGAWFLVNGLAPSYPQEKTEIFSRAVAFLEEGISHHPDNYRLYWELGWLWYREGNLETALKYLDQAEKFPHPFYVASTRAHILAALGKKQQAIDQWKLIEEKFPQQRDLARKFLKRLTQPEP